MYTNVSAQYKTTLNRYSRTFRAKLGFAATGSSPAFTLSSGISSIKIESGSNPDMKLAIGSTPCALAQIEVNGTIAADIKGRDFDLKIGLLTGSNIDDDNDYTFIPFGAFSVQDVKKSGGKVKIEVADYMAKADKDYQTSLLYPNTAENILNDICNTLGITFQPSFDFLGYTMLSAPVGRTFREMIGFIASMYGKSAIFDRNGVLCFKWYEEPETDYFFSADRIKEPEINESEYTCEFIDVTLEDGSIISTDEDDHTDLQGISIENPYMTNGKLAAFKDDILDFSYRPIKIEALLGDPLIDPFDILYYTKNNVTYTVLPMTIKYEFDGGLMMTVSATKKETASYTSPTQRYEKNTQSAIKSAVIVNRGINGQTVAIGSTQKRILSMSMAVVTGATTFIVFTAQTNLTTGGTVNFVLKLNNSVVFTFKQICVIGDHIANFMFPFQGLSAGSYTIEVDVVSSDAIGAINAMSANAIITGAGMSIIESWNGILTLAAELSPVTMADDNGLTVGNFGTTLSTSLLVPQTSQMSAKLMPVTMSDDSGLTVSGFAASFTVGEYPYYLGMTSDGDTKIYITLDGDISTDSTLTDSLASFTIQSIISGVSTFYTPQSVTATYDAINSETTLEITTATAFTAAEYIDVAYNANTGTIHVGTLAEGHKVPAFSDTITFNRS